MYKTNAAIWYNKISRQKQLTPIYMSIKVKGKEQFPDINKLCNVVWCLRIRAS